jgi:hypothetical protein
MTLSCAPTVFVFGARNLILPSVERTYEMTRGDCEFHYCYQL